MIKSFNMATTPERFDYALKTIESIYDQADVIRVYLNNFKSIPKKLIDKKILAQIGPEMCCSGRLLWAKFPDQYYFIIDDDIIYPKNYSKDMLRCLKNLNDKALVSLHGKILNKDILSSFFNDHLEIFHYQKGFKKSRYVHVIGAGVCLFNTNFVDININSFQYNYMDDIEISIQLQKQKIPAVVIAHDHNYLKSIDLYKEKNIVTLFSRYRNDDETQTERYNQINWKINKFFNIFKILNLKID